MIKKSVKLLIAVILTNTVNFNTPSYCMDNKTKLPEKSGTNVFLQTYVRIIMN